MLNLKKIFSGIGKFIKSVIKRYFDHDLSQLGGQVAFFSILSLLPLVIYINTLITSFNFSHSDIMNMLVPVIPESVAALISEYVQYISDGSRYGILSIGIITTIYSASKMIRSVEKSINKAHGINRERGFFHSLIISMVFIICIGIIFLVTLYFSIVGANIVAVLFRMLHLPMAILEGLKSIRWVVFMVALFFTVSLLYFVMPYKKIRYRYTLPGTAFFMVALGALSEGYRIYIKYGFSLSSVYGPLGAVFLVFIWIYLVAIALILGAEINNLFELMPEKE